MNCSLCNNEIDKQYTAEGVMFWDKGHNPQPVLPDANARCCSTCNDTVVILARVQEFENYKP